MHTTPTTSRKHPMKTTTKVMLGITIIITTVAVLIGGWHLNWWMKDQSTNKTAVIYQDSYGRQNALIEAILQEATDATDPNIPQAQRTAIITEMCFNAAKLTGAIALPFNVQTLINQECQ